MHNTRPVQRMTNLLYGLPYILVYWCTKYITEANNHLDLAVHKRRCVTSDYGLLAVTDRRA